MVGLKRIGRSACATRWASAVTSRGAVVHTQHRQRLLLSEAFQLAHRAGAEPAVSSCRSNEETLHISEPQAQVRATQVYVPLRTRTTPDGGIKSLVGELVEASRLYAALGYEEGPSPRHELRLSCPMADPLRDDLTAAVSGVHMLR